MNYGRQVLLMADHVTRPSGGMADAQTRGGVFRPGGNGGGIFDGSMQGVGEYISAQGLGEYITADDPHGMSLSLRGLGADTDDYPWRQKSEPTRLLQAGINGELRKLKGACLLGEDGVLGPSTCGAAQYLSTHGVSGLPIPSTCGSFTMPSFTCGTGGVLPPPHQDTPPPTTELPGTTHAGLSMGQWGLIGLGLAALGYGAYRLAKKRH